MRSWARRILLVATICMALVIFCVDLTLALLTRISFVPGIRGYWFERTVLDEVFADRLERGSLLLEPRLGVDGVVRGLVRVPGIRLQRGLVRRLCPSAHLDRLAVVCAIEQESQLVLRHG